MQKTVFTALEFQFFPLGWQRGLNTGAFGFASMVAAVLGIWYGILSFMEKDCKYILARIGIGISAVLVIVWAVILIIGFFR